MSNHQTVQPADILADGIDTTTINGKPIRKGTIAAFLANIELFETAQTSASNKTAALKMIKQLAPAVVAIGLPKYVVFKNPIIESILLEITEKKI